MNMSPKLQQLSKPTRPSLNSAGQIIIEYVLLLSFVAVIAVMLLSTLARRGESLEDSGLFIKKWHSIREAIGKDEPVGR